MALAIFEHAVERYSGNFEGRGLRCENGGGRLDPANHELLEEILETQGKDPV